MPSTARLNVAIYDDGGVYKHWALFVDGPTDAEKVVLNIMGSSTRYHFEMSYTNAHTSDIILEMIYLCDVEASNISAIKDAAQNAVIHNEHTGYNCQDYVLGLLDTLEEKGIVEGSKASYKKSNDIVKGKQEGLL